MTANIQLLQKHLGRIKRLYEREIRAKDGNPGFLIRSGRIIDELHEYLKGELVNNGVKKEYIHPPLGKTSPELPISGYFKSKKQDLLVQKEKNYPLISINIRSQLSSVQKNYDTLFERLVAEAVNIHEKFLRLPCGYLYLLPAVGYNSTAMKKNKVIRDEYFNWEKYLITFSLLANRNSIRNKSFKYERICLLAVDFSLNPPVILSSIDDFLDRNLIDKEFTKSFDYSSLGIDDFIEKLIAIFNARNKIPVSRL
ncbi:hypothetical protein MYX07_03345 [Patescibacteria group bacterium AH-259-L07]|nr:hypothetical protein [Patescibacteria group bacterium AH-259-L07]